jgi:hypothetical protein
MMNLFREAYHDRGREKAPTEIESGTLTEYEASRFLKIGVRTLQKLRKAGRGPRFCRFGKAVRYPRHLLLAFLDEQAEGGAR